jgi:SAM-dependent methyltransferase
MTKDTIVLKVGEYFMAVEGLAMMRHIITDPERGRARGEDMRRIVENFDAFPQNLDLPVTEHDVESGYTKWAPKYDGPGNMAIEYEEPVVRALMNELPAGDALDAACGTGRHAAMLAQLGHRVVGVDATEAMLAVARTKVPEADFRRGALEALPVDDASVDLVTSGAGDERVRARSEARRHGDHLRHPSLRRDDQPGRGVPDRRRRARCALRGKSRSPAQRLHLCLP